MVVSQPQPLHAKPIAACTTALPFREISKSTWGYRSFWRACAWQVFFEPEKKSNKKQKDGSFEAARLAERAQRCFDGVPCAPGVYEFALQRFKGDHASKRYKVYVGHSGDLRRRVLEYRNNGSHLRPFFEEALANKCQLLYRFKALSSVDAARAKELQLLQQYDFAWNMRQNGAARHVAVKAHICGQVLCCWWHFRVVSKPAKPTEQANAARKVLADLPTVAVTATAK